MKKTERFPRPMGTTFLAISHTKNPTEANKDALKKHIINAYITQGLILNGKSYDLLQVSQLLQIPLEETMKYFTEISQSLGTLLSPEKISDTLKTAMSMALTWSLQDKGRIQQQVQILSNSQGDKYKPFISSELTKALKINLDANKNIMEFFKTLATQSTTINIFNATKESKDSLSPFEALSLIQAENKSLSQNKENHLNQLYLQYNLNDIPELSPNTDSISNSNNLSTDNSIKELLNTDSGTLGQVFAKELGPYIEYPNHTDALADKPFGSPALYPKIDKKVIKKRHHDDPFQRRGLDIQDTDILP